ncbi:MAG: hypothetical protein KAT05_02610 [Spirochaetes bacterium]|nr:hypothetical protein [Spirochaetota bacterium]
MSRFEWANIRLVLLLLLVVINSIPIGHAEEEPLTIFLDCYKPCRDAVVNYSEIILFNLTIKNNLDEWVELQGSSNLQIMVSNDRLPNIYGKESDTYYIFQSSFLIEPKSEINVYFPFKIYNNFHRDSRIGDWKISPTLSVKTILFHNNPFEPKGITYHNNQQSSTNYISGNVLQFEAKKPELSEINSPYPETDESSGNNILTNVIDGIISNLGKAILFFIFSIALLFIKTSGYFNKRKKKK